MYLGLPVIAYNVSYNRTTTESKAVYFNNAAELQQIIQSIKVLELKKLGQVMKEIADRRYTWKYIASKYDYHFEEVLGYCTKERVVPVLADIKEDILLEYNAAHLKHQKLFFEKELQTA